MDIELIPESGANIQFAQVFGGTPKLARTARNKVSGAGLTPDDQKYNSFSMSLALGKDVMSLGYRPGSRVVASIEPGFRYSAESVLPVEGGPAMSVDQLYLRLGGAVGFESTQCRNSFHLNPRLDALAGVDYGAWTSSFYVGGRLGVTGQAGDSKVGAYLQLDHSVSGVLRGDTRGSVGITLGL